VLWWPKSNDDKIHRMTLKFISTVTGKNDAIAKVLFRVDLQHSSSDLRIQCLNSNIGIWIDSGLQKDFPLFDPTSYVRSKRTRQVRGWRVVLSWHTMVWVGVGMLALMLWRRRVVRDTGRRRRSWLVAVTGAWGVWGMVAVTRIGPGVTWASCCCPLGQNVLLDSDWTTVEHIKTVGEQ